MALTYVPIPPEEPSGAIRHLGSSALLAAILILAFAFAACGGDDGDGTSEVQFASVSAGSFHTCGVGRDGSVECWGFDLSGQATPPSGEFASVSSGWRHTCGVRPDGSVQCWGYDRWGRGLAAELLRRSAHPLRVAEISPFRTGQTTTASRHPS